MNDALRTMKRCNDCGIMKPEVCFGIQNRAKGYLKSYCKECTAVRDKAYFARKSQWVRDLKDGKACADCGVTYPWYVLQWDHLDPTKKEFNIRATKNRPKDRLLREIAKCELVCANCHAERTHNRRIGNAA